MRDDLGDRMKLYEEAECGRRAMPHIPVMARVDGRKFSSFTKGMRRPFDERMQKAMISTAMSLAVETNACTVYTQSDEITLVWCATGDRNQIWFDGRIFKMVSQLAAQATLAFFQQVQETLPDYADRCPTFDARVWQVPNKTEAVNAFIWREQDAVKNSITMAASEFYSHKALHGKSGKEKQELLFQQGINWNDYPVAFKRGTYIQRRKVERAFNPTEIAQLPNSHEARADPSLTVLRTEWQVVEMPILSTVANREDVIFSGAVPITKEDVCRKNT